MADAYQLASEQGGQSNARTKEEHDDIEDDDGILALVPRQIIKIKHNPTSNATEVPAREEPVTALEVDVTLEDDEQETDMQGELNAG